LSAIPLQPANVKAIGLVSGAHMYSHLYIFLLPPLFPILKDTFGVGYTELALAVTLFNVVTGLTQAPMGFLVDRIGARTLLIVALIVESLALAAVGLAPSYVMLLAMMAIAGLANAVFHPADYVILNASVDEKRMGRAFSVHTASGFFGGFLAPALAIPLASFFGWQTAVVVLAGSGMVMAALLIAGADALRDAGPDTDPSKPPPGGGLALLFSGPVLMGFAFYVGLSAFGQGLGNFNTSALSGMYEAPLTTLGIMLSLYMFANPVGVLCGGWVADKIEAHDRFAALCLVGITLIAFLIAAVELPLWLLGIAFTVAGLLNGVLAPSRDMLVRKMTPPGQIGKVFGFVTSGFNVAGMVAPPLFGYLLDHGAPSQVFWVAGAFCLITIPTVLVTGATGRRAQQR
jgi:MFS transporter, FSR family, fosmidomycin resistance protein